MGVEVSWHQKRTIIEEELGIHVSGIEMCNVNWTRHEIYTIHKIIFL
jgi:hypothetical protein